MKRGKIFMLTASGSRALVDSNILVYAYQPDESRHTAAVDLLDRLLRQRDGVISVQNLAELCNVVLSKTPGQVDGERLARFTANMQKAYAVVSYRPQTIIDAVAISARHSVHFFDALLAATMLENKITTIYTENADDFAGIPGIRAVNPFA